MQPDNAAELSGGVPSPEEQAAALPDVRQQLLQAGPAAVQFLVDALLNEELSYKERIDIAKDLLNRGFGKTLLPQQEPEQPSAALRIELSPEVAAYAD